MTRRPRLLVAVAHLATALGVAALLALKPATAPEPREAAPARHARATPPTPATSSGQRGTATRRPTERPTTSSSPRPASSTHPARTPTPASTTVAPPPAPTTRTVSGATISTKYGPVQVRIVVRGGTVTDADAVRYPTSTPRSVELSDRAVPQLNQWAVAAQSAQIDTVSGATYTSQGYRQSLQSALDRAGL